MVEGDRDLILCFVFSFLFRCIVTEQEIITVLSKMI